MYLSAAGGSLLQKIANNSYNQLKLGVVSVLGVRFGKLLLQKRLEILGTDGFVPLFPIARKLRVKDA
jgi:hypothetical protein